MCIDSKHFCIEWRPSMPSIARHEMFLSRIHSLLGWPISKYPLHRPLPSFRSFFFFFFRSENQSVTGARIFRCGLLPSSLFITSERFRSFTIERLRDAFAVLISRAYHFFFYRRVNSRSVRDLFSPKQQVRCVIVVYNTNENRLILYVDNFV